jgi:hypothetical protein
MSIYWLDGRSYFEPNAVSEFGQEETSFALVGRQLPLSRSKPGARPNPLCIRPYFSNSRGRTLVSERR